MKEQENLIKKDPDINPKPSQTPFTSKIKWQSKGFRLFILFIAVALLSFFVYKVYDSSHYSYDKTNPILSAIYEKAQTCKMGKTLQQNIHATNSNTGFYLPFEKGNVYYFQSKGTFALWGPVLHMWESNQYEKGFLGYPKSDIIETKNKDGENGEYAIFEGGRVYYSDSTNVHYVRGDIDLKYQHSNAERGVLGYPTSNEQNITGYSDGYTLESVFENGRIVWRNNAPQGKPNDTVIVLKSEEPFFQKH